MKEDIKLKIKVDTTEAKKDSTKFFKELEQEANELGKKVSDIKLERKSFSKEEVTELKKEIEATALKAKTIYFSEGNKSAEELIGRLKEMHKALGQTKAEVKQTQDVFTKMDLIVGNLWTTAITKGVGALKSLVEEGIKLNRELEYADKKIQSISNKNSIEIETNISKLSLETGTDSLELREGLYEIISAIGDVPEAYKILETSNKLAITGFTDTKNAIDGLTTVLNAYQMELSEADRVANIFVKTQKYGKITVDEFARDLAQSVPYATQLGIKIEEIGSAIALLTSRGVKPAQAETQLSSFLRNILDDNNELAKELNKSFGMGIKEYIQNGGDLIKIIEEVSQIEKKLGKAITSFSMDSEAKAFILTLKDGKEAYKNFYREISSGKDEINKNMASMMNTQQAALDRATQYWKNLGKIAGSTTSQIIAYIGDTITGFDRQTSATKVINSNLSQSLQTLQELGDKNDKTAEEQKSLNEALNFLKIIAPDISKAYEEFTKTGQGYAEVLKLIEERQKKVNDISNQMTLKDYDKEINTLEKELRKTKVKIGNLAIIDTKTGKYISAKDQVKLGLMSETANADKYEKYLDLKVAEERLQEAISGKTKLRSQYVNKLLGKTDLNDVISTGKNIATMEEIDLSPKSKPQKTKEEIEKEKTETLKRSQLNIQNKFDKLAIAEKQAFNEKMATLIEEGNLKEIEEAQKKHEANLQMIEKERQLAELRLKLNDQSLTSEEKAQVQLQMDKIQTDFETNKIQTELKDSQDDLKKSLDNVSSNLKNLSSLFQTIGDNTGSTSIKNLANIGSLGSTIFDTIKKSSQGEAFLGQLFGKDNTVMAGLGNLSMGAGIGGALSGALGGGAEGNIGSLAGSAIGTVVGGPVGSVVGGAIGGAIGGVFGRSSKKKKKREAERRKRAQERLKKGMISGQFKWADVLEEYNEELQRAGMGEYISLFDKVSANTNYDNILSTLENAKRGADGVSMTTLRALMPQYNDQQIMDWFKSITGGAVLNGDTLSTGEGKYGAIDISALAQQVTNANREMEQSLKETIKNIIDFSADSLASVVKEGFFDGMEDLGDNIEKMIANSLKNAFLNTEISKNLFNGLSDKVADYIKDMFKNDKNLGLDLETGKLEDLSFTQYIDLIKKYMEMSNDKLEELFKELGLNMDNLTESMDALNKNMSKNVVSGIATNLWKQNLGIKEPYKINQNIHLEIPVMLNGKEMDRYIIKTVNGSLQRSRRSGNGIGRG